ncbi:MAG TPA: alpha/beta hydrolase [Rubrobacter sp.]|nr:alpha/beta hydrolase [Rubrobacter sp.]
MRAGRRAAVGRWTGAAVVFAWALLGLLWAQVILLPNALLPPTSVAELLGEVPSSTQPERFILMLFKETSLLLTAFSLLGVLLAALVYRGGARRSSLLAAGLCAVAAAASLAPAAQAWKVASAEDVSLSLPGYFAGPAFAGEHPPETVTYASPGGEALEADVWRPPDEGAATAADDSGDRPAVIVVHGGGWRSGERGDFPLWNAWFANQGYVVFDIDYRLSPPPTWKQAPADVGCAVGWVKENAARYHVDPEQVVLMGRSAGAHLALLSAYTRHSVPEPGCGARYPHDTGVAAVVAFYPPTDLARLSSQGYLVGMDRFMGGTPKSVPGRYRDLSPISHVDPHDPPTFLAHGGDDQIVPPEQSGLLAGRLREAGVPHQLVELPWANHTFDFRWGGWGSQITRSTLQDFLEVHLAAPRGARDHPSPQDQ